MVGTGWTVIERKHRAMVFVRNDNGCLLCLSHKVNQDGYLRKVWKRAGVRVAEMFHRFIYRAHKGEIPEGHEVDHLCNTRGCCEPSHLEAKSRLEHLVKTNTGRYAARKEAAREWWLKYAPSGVELGRQFSVSSSSAANWIREWKREAALQA